MNISIQGLKGSFHHIAADEFFNSDINLLERSDFRSVFEDVESKKADFGMVAIENTIAGSILQNYDLLLRFKHHIVGEQYLRIKHNLIALPGSKVEDITEVRSHPMALMQCEDYLHKLEVKIVETDDTAGSVKTIADNNLKNVAAIASNLAAEIYSMDVLAEGIETDKQNFTRFLILQKQESKIEGANKTSIAVELEDKPGALFKFIQVFDALGVNLTKIESRPIVGKPWNYRFYLDYDMDIFSQKGTVLLEALKGNSHELVVLGSYKKGEVNIL